jgi:hypothetical protein
MTAKSKLLLRSPHQLDYILKQDKPLHLEKAKSDLILATEQDLGAELTVPIIDQSRSQQVPYILSRYSSKSTNFAQYRPWDSCIFSAAEKREQKIELFGVVEFANLTIPRLQNHESLPDLSNVR